MALVCLATACLGTGCGGVDTDVRRRALARIAADPVTARLAITLTVRSGVATVSGVVQSRTQEKQALALVASTAGVMDVINDLRVDDEVITEHVRRALSADPMVGQVPVAITCEEGVVTLRSDRTNAEQRRRLVQLAGDVDGVTAVVDDMQ